MQSHLYKDDITLIGGFISILRNKEICERFTGEVVIKISPNGVDEGWYSSSNKGGARAFHIADLMTIAGDRLFQAHSHTKMVALKEQKRYAFDDSILRIFEQFPDFTQYRFEIRRVNNAKAMKAEYIRHQNCMYMSSENTAWKGALEHK